MKIGFVGLGVMGSAMAMNLARAGVDLVVWNRTPEKCQPFKSAGARVAGSLEELFDNSSAIILMLANSDAIDATLGRGTPQFARMVAGRTIVHMGTTDPEFSRDLGQDILDSGGQYVEAPVSGSRKPAEAGQLVGMLAGDPKRIEELAPVFQAMCAQTFFCGPSPNALLMKLAVNLYLITMVTGLAEAAHFAAQQGLDLELFRQVLDAGPMASSVSRVKLPKLVQQEFSVQASIRDVLMNSNLVAEAARKERIAAPLLEASRALYAETSRLGLGNLDMAAVIHAIGNQTRMMRESR